MIKKQKKWADMAFEEKFIFFGYRYIVSILGNAVQLIGAVSIIIATTF